jgi:hypothetical protein
MCFLITADHSLEYAIEKIVISNNWQNQQLCTIINNYFANVQSNLVLLHTNRIYYELFFDKF